MKQNKMEIKELKMTTKIKKTLLDILKRKPEMRNDRIIEHGKRIVKSIQCE